MSTKKRANTDIDDDVHHDERPRRRIKTFLNPTDDTTERTQSGTAKCASPAKLVVGALDILNASGNTKIGANVAPDALDDTKIDANVAPMDETSSFDSTTALNGVNGLKSGEPDILPTILIDQCDDTAALASQLAGDDFETDADKKMKEEAEKKEAVRLADPNEHLKKSHRLYWRNVLPYVVTQHRTNKYTDKKGDKHEEVVLEHVVPSGKDSAGRDTFAPARHITPLMRVLNSMVFPIGNLKRSYPDAKDMKTEKGDIPRTVEAVCDKLRRILSVTSEPWHPRAEKGGFNMCETKEIADYLDEIRRITIQDFRYICEHQSQVTFANKMLATLKDIVTKRIRERLSFFLRSPTQEVDKLTDKDVSHVLKQQALKFLRTGDLDSKDIFAPGTKIRDIFDSAVAAVNARPAADIDEADKNTFARYLTTGEITVSIDELVSEFQNTSIKDIAFYSKPTDMSAEDFAKSKHTLPRCFGFESYVFRSNRSALTDINDHVSVDTPLEYRDLIAEAARNKLSPQVFHFSDMGTFKPRPLWQGVLRFRDICAVDALLDYGLDKTGLKYGISLKLNGIVYGMSGKRCNELNGVSHGGYHAALKEEVPCEPMPGYENFFEEAATDDADFKARRTEHEAAKAVSFKPAHPEAPATGASSNVAPTPSPGAPEATPVPVQH